MTLGYGFPAVTGALQIFGPQDQRNRKRSHGRRMRQMSVAAWVLIRRGPVRYSRIRSRDCRILPGVSVVLPDIEPLMEDKSLPSSLLRTARAVASKSSTSIERRRIFPMLVNHVGVSPAGPRSPSFSPLPPPLLDLHVGYLSLLPWTRVYKPPCLDPSQAGNHSPHFPPNLLLGYTRLGPFTHYIIFKYSEALMMGCAKPRDRYRPS